MTDSTRILVCDHRGSGLAASLRPLAGLGWVLEESASLGTSRRLAATGRAGVLVLDPLSRDGAAELEPLLEARPGPAAPVLVVADPGDPLPALQVLRRLGGVPADVVYRDAPLEEVQVRLERLLQADRGRVELEDLRFQAVHDDRTRLLRPVPFQDRLREHFSAAQRHELELALVLLDLDRFGRVNKEYDHTVGDRVIGEVGRVVREFLRAEDVGGRLGGDEFALLLPYTRPVDAARVVNRVREQVALLSGTIPGAGDLRISCSLGFQTTDGRDVESVEALRRHAELALRRAKELGGDRGVYYRSLRVEGPGSGAPDERGAAGGEPGFDPGERGPAAG